MMLRPGRIAGIALALLATVAAYGSWSDARRGGRTSEMRTAEAIERTAAASALVVGGESRATEDSNGGASMDAGKEPGGTDSTKVANELRAALGAVREALAAFPGNPRAWVAGYRVIETSRILGLDAAIELPGDPSALSAEFIEGAKRCDPNGAALQHLIGTVMLSAGHSESAFPYLSRAARDLGSDPVKIAAEMLDAGYPPDDVLEAMPHRAEAQLRVGNLLRVRRLDDLAESAFRDAVRLDPRLHEAWTALALLSERRGRFQEALDEAKRALSVISENGENHDVDHATHWRERARALSCAARSSRALGDLSAAASYGSRAIESDPLTASHRDFMATVLSESGDHAGAIDQWQRLIDHHSADPFVAARLAQIHRRIAASYEALGMRERAVEHYLDALRASPRDASARAALERLTQR